MTTFYLRTKSIPKTYIGVFILLFFLFSFSFSQSISFNQSFLDFNGKGSVSQGTFIQFGPDGRLYVMELKGLIKVFDVQKVGPNNYKVTAAETINAVKNIPNHNDDGSSNSGNNREATALYVGGTSSNPVLYVSSSDWRVGGPSGDKDLDTNSGVITRLTWNGSSWVVVDIIRGLPRSEENHATHGLEFAIVGGKPYLLVCQGGHTNAGSPSNNFAWSTEYALSAAILAVDLNQINGLSIKTDGSSGRKYIYDVPTLDDPTRNNVNGITDPNAPGYNGIDVNDPWGGNDGLNQGKLVQNGPIEIFSPGYRNSYDITLTQSGAVYVTDNGANGGWGGFPENEGLGGNVTNNYRPGEPGSSSSDNGEAPVNNNDHLTLITNNIQSYTFGSFYGGHPNPVRANPSGAGLFTRGSHSSDPGDSNGNGYTDDWFRTSILGVNNSNFSTRSLPVDWPPVPVGMANPVEGDFRNPGGSNPDGPDDDIVTTLQNNSNGIDEYTASNFGGAMQGDLIIGRSSNLHRIQLNSNGSLKSKTHNWTSGLGGNALGVTCNSDSDPFPGTIWVATYNSAIVILEPNDAVTCLLPGDPGYDPNADNDSDGYTNQDEDDNGTDLCSGSSKPNDFDGDFISDLNDPDDDGDGTNDASDPFQLGSPFNLPVMNELFSDQPQFGGYLGLGFTGLMNNGAANPNYLSWLDDPAASSTDIDDILGGAIGAVTMYQTSGDAYSNTQEKGFQYGVNVDTSTDTFEVAGRMMPGFHNHLSGQSQALFIGDGFQDNYIKIALSGLTLSIEGESGGSVLNGLPSKSLSNIPGNLDLYFIIDPVNGMVQCAYSLDDGATRVNIGSPFTATGSVLNAIQNPSSPLAVGIMGTSASHPEYAANWDFLNVYPKPSVTGTSPVLNPIANQTNQEGDAVNLQVNASGGDGSLTYGATGLPTGLSINSSSGLISGTISAGASASSPFTVNIIVDDSDGDNSDEQTESFTWTVNSGSISGPTDIWLEAECATVGAQWTEVSDVNASDGKYLNPPSGTSASSAPSSPDDLVQFQVDISQAGAYKVFARIQAASGDNDSYWVRANGGSWQKWNKINSGSYGSAFQWSQVGNWTSGCCATPVTFNLVQGSNTIDFSWREPNTNLDKIFVTLTGSVPSGSGGAASNCGQGTPIIVTPVANQTNNEGDNANVTVMASGGDGNLGFAAVNLPTGVTIDPTNGLIGGTIDPGASVYSPYNVTITVDDSDTTNSDEVVINFTWTVHDPNAPIAIVVNSISNQQHTEGDPVNLQVNASGGNGALQYSATGLPTGLSINLNSGLISGTIASGATNNSPYAVSVEVDDSDTTSSDKETINFSWVVDTPGTDITDVWLEAECATVGSQWTEQTNAGASEGKYLAPPNTTNNNWAPATPDDWVTFTFDVTQAGAYKVFARIQATSGSSDSYWVRANGGTWQEWNKINSGSYGSAFQWSQVGNWTGGCCASPVTFNLVAGTNSVDFAWREPNTLLDKIFVTLNGSVPGGLGDPAGNCGLLQIPIQLTGISNQSDAEGDNINLQVSASGGDGPLSYQATGLPSGLSIHTTSGLISGTIANGASTTSPYNITITVDDNDTTSSDAKTTSFNWTIHDPNAPIPIVISSISNQQNDEGDNVSLQVNASGGNGTLSFQASGLPTGLSINPNTGLISGIIANGAEANSPFAVAITVDDSDSDLSDIEVENFLWEVFIPSVSVTDFWLEAECATVGNLWTEVNDNSASGGKYLNPPNSSSLASAPTGVNDLVSFDFDVTDPGAYKVFARIQSTSGNDDSYWVRANGGTWQEWNKINSGSYGAFFQWSQVGNWTSGCCASPVTFNLVAGTNTVDFAWREPGTKLDKIFVTLTGSVPTGSGLNASNCDSGTPIQLNSIADQQSFDGDPVSLQVNASGGDGSLSYQASGLPGGLSINNNTGLISGTISSNASASSPFFVTVTVDDSDANPGDVQTINFNWDVFDPAVGVPIVLSSIGNQSSYEGNTPTLQVNASGGDGSLTYQASGLPSGLSINSSNGLISGTISSGATSGSPYSVIVTVDDADGFSSDAQTTSFDWIINVVSSIPDTWNDVNTVNDHIARSENSFVQAGDKFYLFGGRQSPQTLEIYDIYAKSWTTGANAPEQFNHFQATEYDGLVWVIGAFYLNNYPNEPPEDNIHIYDPAKNEWIVGPTIPSSRRRGSTGLAVYNDKFYIVCGNTIGHNGGYVNWFDEYDPIHNTWTPLANAPRSRDHFNAVVVGNKLYAAGGRLSGGTGGTFAPMISEVDVYNFNTNSWSTLPSTQNIPTPRAGVAAVNFQDQVVVIGGEGNGNAYPNAEAYDPSTSTWTTLDPMNHQRHGTQAIVSGDGIYTTGGSFKQGGGSQTNMEVYGIENPQGSASVAGVMSAPNNVNITQNGSGNIVISHTGGNVGIFVRSLQITNVTGGSFSITNGNPGAGGFLLKTGTSHTIEVSLGNNTAGQSANLVINYGKNSSKTVSINGVASSSASRQITGNAIDMNRQIQVYPNPTDGQPHLQVALSLVESDQVSFRLADLAGKTVLKLENRIVEPKSISKVPVGDLAKGVYLLQIQGQNWQEYRRVVID